MIDCKRKLIILVPHFIMYYHVVKLYDINASNFSKNADTVSDGCKLWNFALRFSYLISSAKKTKQEYQDFSK